MADPASGRFVDFELALIDPGAQFGSPEEVVGDSRLTARNKIEILSRWAYDSAELAVAEEEGMGGGESIDLRDVLRALDRVNREDVKNSAPNKHAGFSGAQTNRPS